ncbi:MAG: DUF1028 domain-containing protein [Pseudohongiellaceae bacterium]
MPRIEKLRLKLGKTVWRFLCPATVMALLSPSAFATWSVIAIDSNTNEMVVASATCVTQEEFRDAGLGGLMDVQAIVAPGKGIAVAQAYVDVTGESQQLIYDELMNGNTPENILEIRKDHRRIERYQYAIGDIQGRIETFSGSRNLGVSIAEEGVVPDKQIYFSVQGNTLRSRAVVFEAVKAFRSNSGNITDRVMAAMRTADENGGDRRCSCENAPIPNMPCTTKNAHVAYILKVDGESEAGESFNDGEYALYINVTEQNTSSSENANPVITLDLRYQEWKRVND